MPVLYLCIFLFSFFSQQLWSQQTPTKRTTAPKRQTPAPNLSPIEPAISDENKPKFIAPNTNQVRLIMENDAFGAFSDRYYTNGARLEFNTTASEENITRKVFGVWNDLFLAKKEESQYLMGFSLGQEFYTPTNITKADVSFGDRPYSSRAYVGHSLTTWTNDASITTELELGMIGPSVGGKSAQINFHNLIGSPTPQGWDTQIPDSYSGAFKTDIRKFWHKYFGTQWNINLGNIQTDTSFGFIFRWGNVDKTPGPGASALQPGAPILYNPGKGFWYFYINPGGTLQIYNATIQGQIGSDKTYQNQNRGSSFSNWDSFLSNPTPEVGRRELLFQTLSEDNGRNTLQRFLLFNEFLVRGSGNPYDFGFNFLLFNNIFNGAEDIDRIFKLILLKNVADEWDSLPDNARAVAIYSLFRPEGGKIPDWIRFYSYQLLSEFVIDDPRQRQALLELLQNDLEIRQDKTYVASLRRAVGFFRAGFVSVSDVGFLVSINYNYQSIDFEAAKGLPEQHQWLGFQLGKVF